MLSTRKDRVIAPQKATPISLDINLGMLQIVTNRTMSPVVLLTFRT